MFQMIQRFRIDQLALHIPPILLVTLIKWSSLFILVTILLSLFKKLTPGNKHLLWLLLIYGLLLVPILSGLLPYSWFKDSRSLSERGEVVKVMNDIFFVQPLAMETGSLSVATDAAPLQSTLHTLASGYNWSLFMVLIWFAGVFIASFRVLIGRFRLSVLQRDTDSPLIKEYRKKLYYLSEEMGIEKKVCLVMSSRCRIPFTYRIFKPVIVFPRESGAWPAERVRAVLLHELAHIRRRDYLTQSIARIICSLFWFIPFVWLAYAKLYQEQEKACDVFVVERGVRPADYASHILDLAFFSVRTVSFQGSFLSKGRKKFLERRILCTLSLKKATNPSKGGKKMKYRNFLLLCGILLIAIALIGSCATRKKAISEEEFVEAYSGTWINTEYSGDSFRGQKIVIYPDGRWIEYAEVTMDQYRCFGKDTINDMWKDSNGDIWYKATREGFLDVQGYVMVKLSDSGNTRQEIFHVHGEPIEEWEPEDVRYHYIIHYRQ